MEQLRRLRTTPAVITAGAVGYVAMMFGMAWLSQASGCTAEEAVAGCQAWLWANPFWGNFYSNLMSTIAGVALGLPVALYLNRKAEQAQRVRERDAEARQRAAERKAETRQRQAERETSRRRYLALLRIIEGNVRRHLDLLHRSKQQAEERAMGTHRFNETTWIGLSREVLVELPSHGELGIRVARLLEEFYGGFPIVQAHLDRLVQFAFAKSASPDTTPSVGSDYVNAMLHTVISEAMERIKLAEELLSALEELAKEIRQAQVT